MGLFDDFDVASADTDPLQVPVGTWQGVTGNTRVQEWQNGTKSLIVTITGGRDGENKGKHADKSLQLPAKEDTEDVRDRKLSFLHRFLSGMGIPKEEMNDVTSADLNNKPVVFTVKQNGEYMNVTKCVLDDTDGISPKGQSFVDDDAVGVGDGW